MDRADQVVLSLSQLDDRYIRGLVGRYYFDLEFRLEKDEPGSSGTVIARSTRGIYTERSVNTEIYLEVGTYNVFLKVTADFIGGHSVKDIVKSYVEENKVKLVQIAKKYNFAHMKKGVGDKDDRVFESLTVEEEAKVKTDEKPKDETDTTESADNSAKEENADTADSKTSDDKSIPVPNTEPSPEVPVENPVTGEPKPVPGPETTPAEKSEKKKKDKSIENWNPVATVGLRLFTRKAKVALSVVQTAIDPSKATANTTPKMADDTKLTILVSGESAKIGNVPPIGDPLPLTPQHETKDTSALLVVDKIINLNDVTTLKLPKDNTNPAVSDTSTSSHPKENQAVIASSSSHPLAMDDGAVKEGAEKIEAAKLTVGEEAASGKIADKSAADINVAAGKSESSSESSRIDMIGTPNSGSGSGLSDGIVHEVKEEDNSAVVV